LTNILRKNFALSQLYLQDYTEMHSQKNIKYLWAQYNPYYKMKQKKDIDSNIYKLLLVSFVM